MKNKATFLLHSFDDLVKHLTNEEAGMLLKAIFDYDIRGTDTEFEDRSLLFLFHQIKKSLDVHKQHYEDVCNIRKQNIKKRWDAVQKDKEKDEAIQMYTNVYKEKEKIKEKENIKENLKENINEKESKAESFAEPDTQTHKKAYGDFKNVYLTDEEYKLVLEKLPDGEQKLKSLSAYMEATGKIYNNHYAQLLNWNFYGNRDNRSKPCDNDRIKRKPPGERREPTFDVNEFTKKALNIKYVPPQE